ncbi:MAG TPA: ribbon-helix-helix domain-containing protein [Caulobacteraceae bacterium]
MLKKRSITLYGHPTSVALEPEFWAALEALARAEQATLTSLIGRIDEGRAGRPLASACRVAALVWAKAQPSS